MGKMDFTEPDHVPLLLEGSKPQTTRQPRKIPIEIGETLYCYYKPRMHPCCYNCINLQCAKSLKKVTYSIGIPTLYSRPHSCKEHVNYFGEAVVTEIFHFCNYWKDYEKTDPIHYLPTIGTYLQQWKEGSEVAKAILNSWAVKDGFSRGFNQADKWFTLKNTKSKRKEDGRDWINWNWDVIRFKPGWTQFPRPRQIKLDEIAPRQVA